MVGTSHSSYYSQRFAGRGRKKNEGNTLHLKNRKRRRGKKKREPRSKAVWKPSLGTFSPAGLRSSDDEIALLGSTFFFLFEVVVVVERH